ncbi:hypothetical protein WT55_08905 [Burkholderia pseudomultivorans]|nr:hypothetical protein WT55_08905 [Burkholderia pseudomultivorans]
MHRAPGWLRFIVRGRTAACPDRTEAAYNEKARSFNLIFFPIRGPDRATARSANRRYDSQTAVGST